jgi:hypothetical protein
MKHHPQPIAIAKALTLRASAEDLRDATAKLCAAVIGGRTVEASYTLHALVIDQIEDVKRLMNAAIASR